MCFILTLFLSVFVLPALGLQFGSSPVCSLGDMGHMLPPVPFTTVCSKLWRAWKNNFSYSRNIHLKFSLSMSSECIPIYFLLFIIFLTTKYNCNISNRSLPNWPSFCSALPVSCSHSRPLSHRIGRKTKKVQ